MSNKGTSLLQPVQSIGLSVGMDMDDVEYCTMLTRLGRLAASTWEYESKHVKHVGRIKIMRVRHDFEITAVFGSHTIELKVSKVDPKAPDVLQISYWYNVQHLFHRQDEDSINAVEKLCEVIMERQGVPYHAAELDSEIDEFIEDYL